ncbi:MAG: putative enzyme related to lactoylglutathione lyase [Dinoroseobacter sp.]
MEEGISGLLDVGKIVWHDLTVYNALEVKDFYASVVGWDTVAVSMPSDEQSGGDYQDFNMNLPGSAETTPEFAMPEGVTTNAPSMNNVCRSTKLTIQRSAVY